MNNREIKFRVWNKLLKRFCLDTEDGYFGQEEEFPNGIFIISSWGSNDVIQQFTGLRDKNGREIYEGDILEEHHFEDWGDKEGFEYIGVVRHRSYSNDAGNQFSGFVTYPNLNENSGYTGNPIKVDCEVIGNIFENPELLSAK